jgi:hypothetical protein
MNKAIRFDRHARRRMKWRKISEGEVFEVLQQPDVLENSIRGRVNAYKAVGRRYLKVTFKEFPEDILIISVVDKST